MLRTLHPIDQIHDNTQKIPRSSHNQWSMVEGNTNQIVKSTNHSCLTWIVKKFRIINSNLDIVPYFPARMRTIWIKSNHGNHPHEHTRVNNKNKKQRKHTVNLHQLQSHNSTSIVWKPCPLYLIPNFSLFGGSIEYTLLLMLCKFGGPHANFLCHTGMKQQITTRFRFSPHS